MTGEIYMAVVFDGIPVDSPLPLLGGVGIIFTMKSGYVENQIQKVTG